MLRATMSAPLQAEAVSQVRPWVRFLARIVDLQLFNLVVNILLGIFLPVRIFSRLGIFANAGVGFMVLFSWIFVESMLLSRFHTTPGKSLLKTRLLLAGSRSIPFSKALKRSFAVWWGGLGAGVGPLILVALFIAYIRLKEDSVTNWDKEGGFNVVHEKVGIPRTIIVTILLITFGVLNTLGLIIMLRGVS